MARRRALLIAVDKYTDKSFPDLKSPVEDAKKLKAALSNPRCESFEIETVRPNASLVEIQEKIESFFAASDPRDLTLFYFSGHGKKDRRQRLNFILKDTKSEAIRSTALTADFLKEQVQDCASEKLITILDCCHAGAFTEVGAKGEDSLPLSNFDPDGRGRYTLGAARGHELALEKDGTSLFSKYLIEALTFGGDASSKTKMTVNNAHDYIIHKLRGTKVSMTPPMHVENRRLGVVLARNENYVEPVAAIPAETSALIAVDSRSARRVWFERGMMCAIGLLVATTLLIGFSGGDDAAKTKKITWTNIDSNPDFNRYRNFTNYRVPGLLDGTESSGRAMPWVARRFETCAEPESCMDELRGVQVGTHPGNWRFYSGEPFPKIKLPLLCFGPSQSPNPYLFELALSYPVFHDEIRSRENANNICTRDLGPGFHWHGSRSTLITVQKIDHTLGTGNVPEYLSDPEKMFRTSLDIKYGFWANQVWETPETGLPSPQDPSDHLTPLPSTF